MVGCLSTDNTVKEAKLSNSILDDLPPWILNKPATDEYYYAVGAAKGSTLLLSTKRAEAEGRTAISQWIQTSVKEVITTYVSDAGSGDNRQNLDAFEAISVQVSQTSLQGVKREKLYQDDDRTVYVLMSIPIENIEKAFVPASEAVAETFEVNETAEEANKKMTEAFKKLLNE